MTIFQKLKNHGYTITKNKEGVVAEKGKTVIKGENISEVWLKYRRFGDSQPAFYEKDVVKEKNLVDLKV